MQGFGISLNRVLSVGLRFTSLNPQIVPDFLHGVGPINDYAATAERIDPAGPFAMVKTGITFEQIELTGMLFHEAWYQGKNNEHTIQFNFGRAFDALPTPDFIERANRAHAQLSNQALWFVDYFYTPFQIKGNRRKSVLHLSINFTSRVPLFDPSGQPVLRSPGAGEEAIPIQPELCMMCTLDEISVHSPLTTADAAH